MLRAEAKDCQWSMKKMCECTVCQACDKCHVDRKTSVADGTFDEINSAIGMDFGGQKN